MRELWQHIGLLVRKRARPDDRLMQLDFAFLADFAQVASGKLYVVGGAFDRIVARDVPVVHALMTLAVRMVLTPAEVSRPHHVEVVILDEDGKRIADVNGNLMVDRPETGEHWKPVPAMLTWNFLNVQFERFGSYGVEILVNGSSVKSLPLEIASPRQEPRVT